MSFSDENGKEMTNVTTGVGQYRYSEPMADVSKSNAFAQRYTQGNVNSQMPIPYTGTIITLHYIHLIKNEAFQW